MIARCGALTNGLARIQIFLQVWPNWVYQILNSRTIPCQHRKSFHIFKCWNWSSVCIQEGSWLVLALVVFCSSRFWLEKWTMGAGTMPKLERLFINLCAYLRRLPEKQWRIKSLYKLEWCYYIQIYIMESDGLNGGNNRGGSIVTAAWLSVLTVIQHWSIWYSSFQQSLIGICHSDAMIQL